jgi:hypothetical protein
LATLSYESFHALMTNRKGFTDVTENFLYHLSVTSLFEYCYKYKQNAKYRTENSQKYLPMRFNNFDSLCPEKVSPNEHGEPY